MNESSKHETVTIIMKFLTTLLALSMNTSRLASAAMTTTSSVSKIQHKSYDLVVVGGGSAGLTAAKFAGGTLKKSVCIIEESKLGGDCTWTGCVPSKSLLASAKAAHMARKQAIGDTIGVVNNFADIQARYRENQQKIYESDDSPQALAKFQIDTISGRAVLTSPTTLLVTSSSSDDESSSSCFEVSAKEGILLCTGASPNHSIREKIPGLKDIDYITYEEVWDLKELPKRLTIVGGGPVRYSYVA
jgi:pyruvate/2-oxoglutarate dehydrogenase complex dihydrolipoamide dehydrogenase (E3) component